MNRAIMFLLIGAFGLATMSSCKSRKPKSDCTALLIKYPKDVLTQVSENLVQYDHLSLRVKANYTSEGNSNSFGMNVKMRKDSFVWVSVVAVIEVARAYITPDSFKLIDRFNKKYYVGAITDLKRFTGQDLSLSQLQDLLVANPLYAVNVFEKKNDDLRNDFLQYQTPGLTNRVQVSGCYRSMASEFTSSTSANKIAIDYSMFKKEKGLGYFPNSVSIDANGNNKKFKMVLEYSSVSTTPFDPIRFTIPSKYEKGN
jgi:hypothetical protein